MKLDRGTKARSTLDLAKLALGAGLVERSSVYVRESLRLEPDGGDARITEARAALRQGQPDKALLALDAHDHYHPDLRDAPHVALLRIEALARSGRSPLAREIADRLCRMCPDDVRPHRMAAALALETQDEDVAARELSHVVRLCPSDGAARRALAHLVALEDPQRAIDLLMSDPVDRHGASQRLAVARLLRAVGRERDAVEMMRLLLNEHPEEADLWHEMGLLYSDLGAMDRADKCLRRAVTLGCRRQSRAALATLLMRVGRFAEAGWEWWTLYHSHHDDIESAMGLCVCAMALGRPSVVKRITQKIAAHSSRSERRQWALGMSQNAVIGRALQQAQLGAPQHQARTSSPLRALLARSAQSLSKQAQTHPDRADTFYHLAICQRELGKQDAARSSVAQALSINPRYVAAGALAATLGDAQPHLAA
ncbi:MAG: hypothetical protein GC164_14495 [Phycisphaera sp.]|nr:hypothetical protein [Phycisphaera sp.]